MGQHDGAETAALQALAANVPGALLERCRLLWACDKGHRAIRELHAPVQRLQIEVAGELSWLWAQCCESVGVQASLIACARRGCIA
jgi:hypothetical protein